MITHKNIGYSGRLGNQMFLYAFMKVLSFKTNQSIILPNNTNPKQDGFFNFTTNQWCPQRLDLFDCFDLNCKIGEPNEEDNIFLEGYFQKYSYLEGYEEILIKEFKFKQYILDKSIQTVNKFPNPVSIHIRRGDYVAHPEYWVVTPEYIQTALNHFIDQEYTFLVFSDDIEWCKQVFSEGVIFMEGNTQFEDLCMMSLCQHNIIANSSFSWWGAFLNQNKNKKIIAPSNWFNNKETPKIFPKNWIII